MPSLVRKPAQYSYETGSPAQGEDRNKSLHADFSDQLAREESKLPGNVQEHMKKQRSIQQAMGQQTLAVTRGGGILRKPKIGGI